MLTNDWTIRHENRLYQILEENHPLPKPKDKLPVHRQLDHSLVIEYKGKPALGGQAVGLPRNTTTSAADDERKIQTGPAEKTSHAEKTTPRPPKTNTPWRQGCTLMRADIPTKKP